VVTMSSTINMAFARRPSLGLSTRLLLSPPTGTPSVSLVALRHFATSRRTLQAQPAQDSVNHVKSPRLGTGVYSARDEPDKYVNPYAGGPSALEKAAHLFFFTEIVRGSPMSAVYACLRRN
jgi:NADH dehydrogenase (ubiquinone) Fe-S protein 8